MQFNQTTLKGQTKGEKEKKEKSNENSGNHNTTTTVVKSNFLSILTQRACSS